MFAQTPVVTVRSGIEALRLKLWDEERGRLVRFPARRARSPLPALRRRTTVSQCVDVDASRLTT